MVSVKGIFENGIIRLITPVEATDGQEVIITFLDQDEDNSQPTNAESSKIEAAWEEFERLIAECAVDIGIPDLAHQHDHYLYGTPKRE